MSHAADGVILAASLAEILGALFVAAVAAGCHRSYPRPHLSPWAWSWLSGALSQAVSVVATMVPPRPPLNAVAAVAIVTLRYVQVATLLIGTDALRHRRPVPDGRSRALIAGAWALGVASALFPLGPGPARTVVRSLLPAAALGGALCWAGLALWRQVRPSRVVGARLVAGALLVYGIDRVHRAGLNLNVLLGGGVFDYSLVLGFVSFAFLSALGLGLVLALLEDERRELERTVAAEAQEKERLRLSEEKFAKVFRSSPDAIVVSDPWDGGRIIEVNEGFERLTGYSRQEAIGRTTVELGFWIRPQDRLDAVAVLENEGGARDLEIELLVRNGQRRTFLMSGDLIEVGERRYAVSVSRDVTEHRRAVQRLRESEERLRLALDAAGLGTWEWDIRTGVVSADAQTDALLGMPADGLPGTLDAYQAPIHPEDRALVRSAIGGAISGSDGEFRVEYRVVRNDEPRWIEGKGRVYRDDAGQPVLMRGTVADVTARRLSEESLRESEDRWRRISEATFEGIAFSQDGVMTDTNPQLAEMLGYAPGELIGKPVRDCVALDDRERVAEAIRSGHTGAYQHLALCKDGTTLAVETRARSLTRRGRRIRVTAVRDVSERARLETELRRQETLAAMGSLVAGVAHEVRTPLFSVSATLDALEAGVETPSGQQELRDLLRSQVRRLSNLMQDLLDYGRPPRLRRAPGRIQDPVQRAAKVCQMQAGQAQIRIDLDLPPELPALEADWGRLEQVFHNLIANAVQHSPRGSAVRVQVRPVDRPPLWLACAVEDQGPGLSAADLERVFEPFFSRRKGGTGLGLAIAQRLVEAHGGTLTAANRQEGGAVFTVFLPATATPRTGGAVA